MAVSPQRRGVERPSRFWRGRGAHVRHALPRQEAASAVMLFDAITKALRGRTTPLSGRELGDLAGIVYKAAIDVLCRMHTAGAVVPLRPQVSATWALSDSPAAFRPGPIGALRCCGEVEQARCPHPHGGGGQSHTPTLRLYVGLIVKNFFGGGIEKIS